MKSHYVNEVQVCRMKSKNAYGAWCASRMEWAEKMGISVTFGLSKVAERAEFQVQLLRRQKRSIGSVATQLKTSYEHALELGYDE